MSNEEQLEVRPCRLRTSYSVANNPYPASLDINVGLIDFYFQFETYVYFWALQFGEVHEDVAGSSSV